MQRGCLCAGRLSASCSLISARAVAVPLWPAILAKRSSPSCCGAQIADFGLSTPLADGSVVSRGAATLPLWLVSRRCRAANRHRPLRRHSDTQCNACIFKLLAEQLAASLLLATRGRRDGTVG